MHLLFIRHAESVDNVAGLYGGSRDAALTAHGVLQTRRLASDLRNAELDIRHVFSSPLQRAAKTAAAICNACGDSTRADESSLRAIQTPELREKHFGSWEGVKYAPAASAAPRPPQTDAESPEAIKTRAMVFLDQHLWPAVSETLDLDSEKACVVVVSHGILLATLTRELVGQLARRSNLDASATQISSAGLSWANTGYVDMTLTRKSVAPSAIPGPPAPWSHLLIAISQVNCTKHLVGLRKTRGGIGSAAHDDRQKTLEGFFTSTSRKRKADQATK